MHGGLYATYIRTGYQFLSLQDEHLQHALKNAPDADLMPSDTVRQKVLNYAQSTALPKKISWIVRCLSIFKKWKINSWQLVGMSTIASAVIVIIAMWPSLPKDNTWADADNNKQDVALTESTKTHVAEDNALVQKEQLTTLSDKALPGGLKKPQESNVDVKSNIKPIEKHKKQLQQSSKISSANKTELRIKTAPTVSVEPPSENVVEQEAEFRINEDKVAIVNSIDSINQDKASQATGSSVKAEDVKEASQGNVTSSRRSLAPSKMTISGESLAKQDIQASNFRILFRDDNPPIDNLLVDEETGFPKELTLLPLAEMKAYNQTMRNWYLTNMIQ